MLNFYFADPFLEDYYLQYDQARRQRFEGFRGQLTPESVGRAIEVSSVWPSLPASVVAASAFFPQIPADSINYQRIAETEQNRVNSERAHSFGLDDIFLGVRNAAFDATKTAVRTAFTAFDALYEEGLSRPFKTVLGTLGLTDQGAMAPWEAWQKAGASYGAKALGELISGRPVNLGSGFIPQSTAPTDSGTYTRLLQQGQDPTVAAARASQSLGRPITDISKTERETGLTMEHRPISPGRVVANITWLEPGTIPYNYLSGGLDASAQIFLDPSAAAIKTVGIYRKAAKLFATAEDFAPAHRGLYGLIENGARKTVHGRSVDGFFTSPVGRIFTDFMDTQIKPDTLDDAMALLEKSKIGLSRADLRQIADDVPAEQVWRQAISEGRTVDVPGATGLNRVVGQKLAGAEGAAFGARQIIRRRLVSEDNGLGRLFREMPGKKITVENMDQGMWEFRDYLIAAAVPSDQRSKWLYKWSGFNDLGPRDDVYDLMINEVAPWIAKDIRSQWASHLKGKTSFKASMDKIDAELTEMVTHFKTLKELRKFANDAVGNPMWDPSSPMIKVAEDMLGKDVFGVKPTMHLLAEAMDQAIMLPDARELRNALSPTRQNLYDVLPEWMFDGPFGKNSLQRVVGDPLMKIWKPLTLIRVAWSARVILDEQARLAAEGLDSLWRHPLAALAYAVHPTKVKNAGGLRGAMAKLERGATGVTGNPVRQMLEFQSSMSKMRGKLFQGLWDDPQVRAGWRNVSKGEPVWKGAWTREIVQLTTDELAPRVIANLADAKKWIRSPEGKSVLDRLAGKADDAWNKRALTNPLAMDRYLESIAARAHLKAGGWADLYFDMAGDGSGWTKLNTGELPAEFKAAHDAGEYSRIEYRYGGGDAELLNAMATGELDVAGKIINLRDLDTPTLTTVTDHLGSGRFYDLGPDTVKGAIDMAAMPYANDWQKIIGGFYEHLMTKPTNFLSRSPAFKQYYWQKIEDSLGQMDRFGRAEVYARARNARLPKRSLERIKAKIHDADLRGIDGPISVKQMDKIDALGRAYALEHVKKTLYDVGKKHQIFDQTRNLFPFGEAWLELLTTWSRIMAENPQLLRRGQQGIEGARGSGFFAPDPETGEEMFNYPGGGLITRMLFGPESPAQVQLQGRVAGLNMLSGQVLPGFGPSMQFAAGAVLDGAQFDGMRRLIMPYGERTGMTAVLPGWMTKVFTAMGSGDANTQRLLANTATDIYRGFLAQGRSDRTPEERAALVREANRKAKVLTWIRAGAQFVSPTGPEAKFHLIPKPDRAKIGDAAADDIEGRVWLFTSLSAEWRRIQDVEAGGDEVKAFDIFTRRFGYDPTLFATAKSVTVAARSSQPDGDRWGRENRGLFREAPYTAYYAHPDDPLDERFDYDAYLRSIREGARDPITTEQWAQRRNDTLGRILYERGRREADEMFGTDYSKQKVAALSAWRLHLMGQYFGYRQPNPGVSQQPSIDMKIRELIEVWPNHPELRDSQTGVALGLYLKARQAVVDKAVRSGISSTGWQSADATYQLRLALRTYAEELMTKYPDFANLWQLVLSHELADDSAQLATLGVSGGG